MCLLIPYVLRTYIQMYPCKHKILYSKLMISFMTKMVLMDMVVFSSPSLVKSREVIERHSFFYCIGWLHCEGTCTSP